MKTPPPLDRHSNINRLTIHASILPSLSAEDVVNIGNSVNEIAKKRSALHTNDIELVIGAPSSPEINVGEIQKVIDTQAARIRQATARLRASIETETVKET